MKQGKTFHGTDFNRNFTLNIGTTAFFCFGTDEQFFSAIRLKRKLLVTYCIIYKWKINETQNNQYSIENSKWLLKSNETIAKWKQKIGENREKKNK